MARQMKDSGVEWIGEIPKDWNTPKVINQFDLVGSGTTPKSYSDDYYTDGTINWIQSGDLHGKYLKSTAKKITQVAVGETSALKLYTPNYLVMAMYGASVGNLVISTIEACTNQACCVLAKEKGNLKYMYYVLMVAKEYLIYSAVGGTQPNISQNIIKDLRVPVPSLGKQQKIADFLDEKVGEIDSVIAKTKETIEDYKKYKQAIITDAVTKGLNPDVEMKKSSVDYFEMIPCSWKIIPISIAFNFVGGYAYKSDKFCAETPYQVIRLGNVKNDNFIIEEKRVFIDEEYAKESEKCKILEDDILFTMTGTKGKKDYFYTLIVKSKDLQKKELFLNQRVGCFRKAIKEVFMPYYNYLLKYENICDYIFLFETGTANQGNIGIESINTTKLLLPPIAEQKEIAEYLDEKCSEIDKLIAKKEELLADLEDYKKSLIYEYVTGKKEVE